MAVQAQYPSNIPVADFCLRARQIYNKNSGPFTYAAAAPTSLEDLQQFQLLNASAASNQLAMMNSIAANGGGVPFSDAQVHQHEFIINNGSNKRARGSDFAPVHQLQQRNQQPQQGIQEFHRNPVVSRAAALANSQPPVNTGLRLAFPDDRLSSSSAPPPSAAAKLSPATISLLNEELAVKLERQREEIEQLLRVQEEQTRRAVQEKQRQQSRELFEGFARRLREKDIEAEKQRRDYEERVKQLTMELRLWQNKAKNEEAMVATLRNNLQQALGREQQSREGIGDSDADDAESSHRPPNEEDGGVDADGVHARTYRENKELRERRTCKVCRVREVSILLLPCRHLCLCKDCESKLDACPLCRHAKNASVQVYM